MSNLPTVQQDFPYFRESEEFKAGLRSFMNGYLGIIVFSVCVMAGGVITGLEQGRKPASVSRQEAAKAAETSAHLDAASKRIAAAFTPSDKFQDLRIVAADESLEIHFGISNMFLGGRADVGPAVETKLLELAKAVREAGKDVQVKVEAYTDDSPMLEGATYPSNWELSGARAARIVRVFEKAGFPITNLTFVGWGQAHPLLPNRDPAGQVLPENRMRNRRVVIRLTNI